MDKVLGAEVERRSLFPDLSAIPSAELDVTELSVVAVFSVVFSELFGDMKLRIRKSVIRNSKIC